MRTILMLLALIGGATLAAEPAAVPQKGSTTLQDFNCQRINTCADIKSCEEARYHLTVCGQKKLDRDEDGIPCESLCDPKGSRKR